MVKNIYIYIFIYSVCVKYQLSIHVYVSNLISNYQMTLYIYKEEVSNFISSSLNNQNNHVNSKFSFCFGPDNQLLSELTRFALR